MSKNKTFLPKIRHLKKENKTYFSLLYLLVLLIIKYHWVELSKISAGYLLSKGSQAECHWILKLLFRYPIKKINCLLGNFYQFHQIIALFFINFSYYKDGRYIVPDHFKRTKSPNCQYDLQYTMFTIWV